MTTTGKKTDSTQGKGKAKSSSKQMSLLSFFGKPKSQKSQETGTNASRPAIKSSNEKKRCIEPSESSPSPTSSNKSRRKKDSDEGSPPTPLSSLASPPSSSPSTAASTPPSFSSPDDDGEIADGAGVEPTNDIEEKDTHQSMSTETEANSAAGTVSVDMPEGDTVNSEPPDEGLDEESSVSEDGEEAPQEEDAPPSEYDSDDGRKLSDYELLRKRNIERNNRRLAELGLIGGGRPWSSRPDGAEQDRARRERQKKKKKQKQRRKIGGDATRDAAPSVPTRRSTRARRSVLRSSAEEASSSERTPNSSNPAVTYQEVEEEEPIVREEQYTVSPVVHYAMNTTDEDNSDESSTKWSNSASPEAIASLKPIGKRLVPPNGLGAIYTLEFYPEEMGSCPMPRSDRTWIVGAGKAGIVALWDCKWSAAAAAAPTASGGGAEYGGGVDPVLSWKAHGGRWVADAKFLPSSSSYRGGASLSSPASPARLLTAANDGCVCLWDLASVSVQTGAPKLLGKTGKELHSSGIFAMDVSANGSGGSTYICTGSKDKTVAVTQLESVAQGRAGRPIWVSDHHCGKVGSVALLGKGTALLASASDDGTIAVHDYRAGGKGGGKNKIVAELADAHNRPHSVVWNPLSNNELMTAGHDEQIHTFDIRHLNQPLASFHGHVPSNTARCKKIHHPVFFNPCRRSTNAEQFILTGGEGSRSLSMFRNQVTDSKERVVSVYSRGKMPDDCGDAGCLAVQGERVAATVDGGEVLLLAPQTTK